MHGHRIRNHRGKRSDDDGSCFPTSWFLPSPDHVSTGSGWGGAEHCQESPPRFFAEAVTTTPDPFAALTELPDQADSAARCPLSLLFTYIRDLTASTAGDESIRP